MTGFQIEINLATHIIFPLFLTGILALGSLFSYYLYKTLQEKIFFRLSLFQITSFIFVILEAIVVYYSYVNIREVAIQLSRIQELAGTAFLLIIPGLLPKLLLDEYPKISKYLFFIGSSLAVIIFIAAFVYPDSFVSVSEFCNNSKTIEASSGRGKAGFLYYIRDFALAIMFILVFFYLMFSKKRKQYVTLAKYLMLGTLITVIFSGLDMIMPYINKKIQVLSFLSQVSYTSLGLTLFSSLAIIGELQHFIDEIKDNQKNLEKEVKNRTNDLKSQIEIKEETEEKLRNEMEKAVEMAEKTKAASQIKSEFLSNITHEIRSPMTAFIELSEDLLETDLTDQQKEEVRTINKSGKSLKRLVSNILDFSRLKSGDLSRKIEEFNLRALISSTADEFEKDISKKNLTFKIKYNAPEVVYGCKNWIEQILRNLIDNAIKFTKKGKVTVFVSAEKKASNQYQYHINVQDTGIGISGELQEVIFKPFKQADSSNTREFGGTGIGLTLTKQLVELIGGNIKYESEPGEGSTFIVSIPLKISKVRKEIEE